MRQPAAAPLDHFCILFLREKDVPARHERRSQPPAGGRAVPAPKPRCGAMGNLVAWPAAVLQIKPRARHPAPEGAQLPPEDIADGRNEKQNRVCRDSVTNKTRGVFCRPQVRGRRVAAAKSRIGAGSDLFA